MSYLGRHPPLFPSFLGHEHFPSPDNEEGQRMWKRGEEKKKKLLAFSSVSSTKGKLSEIDNVLTCAERVYDPITTANVLKKIEWNPPPTFPRRSADDQVVKGLLALAIPKHQDPYITRITKEEDSKIPFIYVKDHRAIRPYRLKRSRLPIDLHKSIVQHA
jgi:hypothetical protein